MKHILPFFICATSLAFVANVTVSSQEIKLTSYGACNSDGTYTIGFAGSQKAFSAGAYLENNFENDGKDTTKTDSENIRKLYFFDGWILKNAYFKISNKTIDIALGSLSFSGMLSAFKSPDFSSLTSYSVPTISTSPMTVSTSDFTSSPQPISAFFQCKTSIGQESSKRFAPRLSFIYTNLPSKYYRVSKTLEYDREKNKAIFFSHVYLPYKAKNLSCYIGLGHCAYYQSENSETTWFLSNPIRDAGFYSILGLDTTFESSYLSARNTAYFSQRFKTKWDYANRSELLLRLSIQQFEANILSRFFFSEPEFITAEGQREKTRIQGVIKPHFALHDISLFSVDIKSLELGFLGEYAKKTLSVFPLKEEESFKGQVSFLTKSNSVNILYTASVISPLDFSLVKNSTPGGNSMDIAKNSPRFLPRCFVTDDVKISHKADVDFSFAISAVLVELASSFSFSSYLFRAETNTVSTLVEKCSIKTKSISVSEKISLNYKKNHLETFSTKTNLELFQFSLGFETQYQFVSQLSDWALSFSYQAKF